MRPAILAAAAALTFASPAMAQSDAPWAPCLASDATMESLIGAFQAEGWAFPTSNEEHLGNLSAVGEALFAIQMLPDVQTGVGFDRHIARAHEGAEQRLIDSPSLSRDGLVLAIEVFDNAGGMVRCTIAGTAFPEVTETLDSSAAEVNSTNGHDSLMMSVDASPGGTDVTYYRVATPSDATVEAQGPLATIVTRHLQ